MQWIKDEDPNHQDNSPLAFSSNIKFESILSSVTLRKALTPFLSYFLYIFSNKNEN